MLDDGKDVLAPTMASLGLKKEKVMEEEYANMPTTSEDGVLDIKGEETRRIRRLNDALQA